MKKFNITSEKLATIAFTCIIWLCVLIAAAFALQEPTNVYGDAIGAIGYLCVAGFFEWMKYKVIQYQHEKECEECDEWQRCTDLTEG